MALTITGQISNGAGANQLVTCQPAAWPIKNSSGMSATDPGIATALCDANGNWSIDASAFAGQSAVIATPQGSDTGTLPASGATSLAALKSGSGWTGPAT